MRAVYSHSLYSEYTLMGLHCVLSVRGLRDKIAEYASRRSATRLDFARARLRILCVYEGRYRPICTWKCPYVIKPGVGMQRLLFVSIRCANIRAVRALLRMGASSDTTAHCTAPLYVASYVGSLEIVHMLLLHGALPNVPTGLHSVTPLMIAAQEAHLSVMLRLLWAGADATQCDSSGRTAADISDISRSRSRSRSRRSPHKDSE